MKIGDDDADPLRPARARRLDAAQSDPHGPLDPLPRRHAPGAESAHADLLRAARVGRPHPERGDLGGAHGRRLPRHAGDLVRRAGGGMEAGHRRRSRSRRAHVPAALACRPDLRSQFSRQCAAGGAQRDRGEGQCQPASPRAALSRSPCARGPARFPVSCGHSAVGRRMPRPPASTASRSTGRTAICWTSFSTTAPTIGPTATADPSRIAPG